MKPRAAALSVFMIQVILTKVTRPLAVTKVTRLLPSLVERGVAMRDYTKTGGEFYLMHKESSRVLNMAGHTYMYIMVSCVHVHCVYIVCVHVCHNNN